MHPTLDLLPTTPTNTTPQGKHLFGIFKEAKSSYKEKKASINHERSLQRSHTFDAGGGGGFPQYYETYEEYDYGHNPPYGPSDARSNASGRSRRSHHSPRPRGAALTEANLRTHSEVSATPPSARPQNYRSPYAETSRDMTFSRPSLARAPTEGILHEYPPPQPTHPSYKMQRSASDPSLKHKKGEGIDMDLAYGNVPPDLASRTDLDPLASPDGREAKTLIRRVEGLLEEAQCVQHSAGATISHLQRNPDAAAAVALTLAELSTILGKMSPAVLGVLKGGSPAVFALLASPQFLIAAGAAVGVTVVMFGGWKIIKRMKEKKALERQAMAFEAMPMGGAMPPPPMAGPQARGFAPEEEYYYEGDPQEALVIERELSGIESWRRGIAPFGENGEADMELISPEASRAMKKEKKERRRRRRSMDDLVAPDDSISMAGRTEYSHRSHRSHRSHQSHRSHRSERTHHSERRGSRDEDSEVSRRSGKSKKTVKTIEGPKDDGLELVFRGKEKKGNNMLKSLFKKKKEKEEGRALSIMV